jgi:hypothetical protein
MAIALDNDNIGAAIAAAGLSTSIAVNTTAAVPAGGFIVACIGINEDLTVTGVSGGGLTWVLDHMAKDASDYATVCIASAQCPAGLASGTTITANFSGNAQSRYLGMSSFTGVKTSNPVDGTPIGTLTMASVQPWSTGNYTIQAGSLIVGTSYDVANGPANTPSAGTELWDINDPAGPNSACAQYRIEASAGAYPLSGSWGSANDSRVGAVAYLAEPTLTSTEIAWITA